MEVWLLKIFPNQWLEIPQKSMYFLTPAPNKINIFEAVYLCLQYLEKKNHINNLKLTLHEKTIL